MAGKKKAAHKTAEAPEKQNGSTAPDAHRFDDIPEQPAGALDYGQAQADEMEALKAIYMDDYEEVETKGAWNKADKSFRLYLKAGSDERIHAIVLVKFTATYPKTLPVIALESHGDLRAKTLEDIGLLLRRKPKELLGEVMIFEIASTIQDLLDADAMNRIQNDALPNLEQERANHEATAVELANQQREEEEKRINEEKLEEERLLHQMVQDEMGRRQSKKKVRVAEPLQALKMQSTGTGVAFDRVTEYRDGATFVSFSRVRGIEGLRKGPVTAVFTCRPEVDVSAFTPTLFVLKKVTFQVPGDRQIAKEKIRGLEAYLGGLRRFPLQQNIARLLDFRVDADSMDGVDPKWDITILTEYADGGSLTSMLATFSTIPVDRVRSWMLELLHALEFYHTHGMVHRRIHASNILFVSRQDGNPAPLTIKLADGTFQDVLHDLQNFCTAVRNGISARSAAWIAPELGGSEPKKTAKTDVWELGIVFLQMLFGLEVPQKYVSPDGVVDAIEPSEPLEHLLEQIFHPDAKKRARAFDLIPSEFLRENVPIHSQPSSPATGILSSNAIKKASQWSTRRGSSGFNTGFSRYSSEWVEEGRLGKGGYGEVVKARKKLDSRIYAIKKIQQKSRSALSEILSEVMLLSQLNHPYVVRYYDAWPEEEYSHAPENTDSAITSTPGLVQSDGLVSADLDFGRSAGPGLDFISSSGYPKIQFGEDSEDSDSSDEADESEEIIEEGTGVEDIFEKAGTESSESQEQRKHIALKRTNSSSHPAIKTTLYIQMEYCERLTLRDLIRKGLDENPDDGWRLFRQMLEGLVHIHKHGIIHRDLKPDNVFIDSAGNPRIGDFGLATTGQSQYTDKPAASSAAEGDMTRSVGTAFYVAPELSSHGRGDYTQKVDMYSLGIIFFEMCYALKTAMERDKTIRALRQKDHELPEAFKSPEKSNQGSIILSLINHRPSERPTSTELLRSGKIPVKIEDDIIRHAIEGLSDPSSPYYQQMMAALFSQTPSRQLKDYTWDMTAAGALLQQPDWTTLTLQSLVRERLTAIFSRHGAVSINRQHLFPSSVHYANTTAVQLIDSSGTLVQLPYDLTLPNARALARFPAAAEKTYSFGQVFRQTAAGGAPRSFGEVDFDIVSTDALDLALKEAEVIKVLDEILDEFPCFGGSQMCFHLNHSQSLDIILDFCRIEKPQRPAVKEILSKLNTHQWDWQKIRAELRAPSLDIPSTSLDDLARFDFRDPPEKAMTRIRAILPASSSDNPADRTHAAFSHVRTVAAYLKRFGVRRKVYLSPLSCFNEKFYARGLLFQCVFDNKRRDVLAAGGRYDRLIEEYRPRTPSSANSSHAVGFNLGWDRVVSSMHQFLKGHGKSATYLKKTPSNAKSSSAWTPRRCDVLIASFDAEVLRTTGVKMVAELWSNSISAELAVDAGSPEELLAHYRNDNHNWAVIIKHDSTTTTSGKADLKVKNLITKQDIDIKSETLVSHIRSELRDREHREGAVERSRLLQRLPSAQDGGGNEQRRNEVQVLMAQHRSKKSNKWSIVEAAQSRTLSLLAEYSKAPVAAIETGDQVMEAIRDTRLGDAESWRRAIQSVPLADRQYLGQVQALLQQYRREWEESSRNAESDERPRVAMVFNFRTGGILLYDLGL